jgi:cytochrome c oxidase cbb3-type subunit 2
MRISPWALLGLIPVSTVLAAWWQPPEARLTGIALGRHVYVAEGCIHCHSQYLRPGTTDEAWWGTPRDPEFSRRQEPALIGNRRQGPDLMTAGLRLPRDWHRRHLMDPRSVAPASRMPAYAHLFGPGDPRGEALLDYLASLGSERDSSIASASRSAETPRRPRP